MRKFLRSTETSLGLSVLLRGSAGCQLKHVPLVWPTGAENRPLGGGEAQSPASPLHLPAPSDQLTRGAKGSYFLLGVSAKHFREDVSTTVSQNVTTGSATWNNSNRFVEVFVLLSFRVLFLVLKGCLKPLNIYKKEKINLAVF